MKKLILSVLAIAAMTSCTKSSVEDLDPNAPVEIKLNAGIEVNTIARSSGAITPQSAVDDVVFVRADETAIPSDWTIATVQSIDAKIAATNGAITFTPSQYYNIDKTKNTYLIGYHPGTGATLANGVVTFTGLTGQQDIMYAPVVNGNKSTTEALKPSFSHKLSQLKFKFVKGTGYTGDATITSIKVKGTKLPASMAIADGTITYASAATDLDAFKGKTYALEEATAVDDVTLVEVGASAIKLDITLSDATVFTDVAVNLTTAASTAHVITLTFTQKEISSTATIGQWTEDNSNNTNVQ